MAKNLKYRDIQKEFTDLLERFDIDFHKYNLVTNSNDDDNPNEKFFDKDFLFIMSFEEYLLKLTQQLESNPLSQEALEDLSHHIETLTNQLITRLERREREECVADEAFENLYGQICNLNKLISEQSQEKTLTFKERIKILERILKMPEKNQDKMSESDAHMTQNNEVENRPHQLSNLLKNRPKGPGKKPPSTKTKN